MNPVKPNVPAPIVTIAEDQPEFEPIKVALVSHPDFEKKKISVRKVPGGDARKIVEMDTVLMAFKPTPTEIEQINAGADVYISLLTHGKPQPAIIVSVGPEDAIRDYGLHE